MGEAAFEVRRRLATDFPFYAKNCLKIKTKQGEIIPLVLNQAQQYIHDKIEEQLATTGKVRVIILKGRQQGCSTYVEARFIWKTTHFMGKQAYILTHDEEATKSIFNMTKRFYEHLPIHVQPSVQYSNDRSLTFGDMDSGYKVGTAGNRAVGRSMTNQLLHGSEVAFWLNAQEHASGIMQTVSDQAGTEIILESTANGIGNFFHQQWRRAISGESGFIPIFVPWFWQDEYRRDVPDNFEVRPEEEILIDRYDLDFEQLCWRRNKIIELSYGLSGGEKAFRQEYPMDSVEAFQTSGDDGLITSAQVMRARMNTEEATGYLLVGVDPSRGGDRFTTIKRGGRKAYDPQSFIGDQVDTLGKQVAICRDILDTVCPVMDKVPNHMYVDAGGGDALVDRLKELGYKNVTAVPFGGKSENPKRFTNRRNEMWQMMAEWFSNEDEPVDLVDSDEIQADICASPHSRDSQDRIVLHSKDKIKKLLGFSPDFGDALALTFKIPDYMPSIRIIGYGDDGRGNYRGKDGIYRDARGNAVPWDS